jgi:thiamine monophosphate synthase
VDYAGVGPVRATASKAKHAPVHSTESLAELIAGAAPLPCFAIGGVTAADFPALRVQGAHGIAVSGAIALAADPTAAARALVAAVSA